MQKKQMMPLGQAGATEKKHPELRPIQSGSMHITEGIIH